MFTEPDIAVVNVCAAVLPLSGEVAGEGWRNGRGMEWERRKQEEDRKGKRDAAAEETKERRDLTRMLEKGRETARGWNGKRRKQEEG